MVALLTVALAVGVNVAIFALVRALFLSPLPVTAPDELVYVYATQADRKGLQSLSYDVVKAIANEAGVFSGALAYSVDVGELQTGGEIAPVTGEMVSGNYFSVLGLAPQFGRYLNRSDDNPAAAPVVVISYGLWQSRFHSDPTIIGRPIRLLPRSFLYGWYRPSATDYTIVGVASPAFAGVATQWSSSDYWVPLTRRAIDYNDELPPGAISKDYLHDYWRGYAIARLNHGVKRASAAAFLAAVSNNVREPARADVPAWSLIGLLSRQVKFPFDSLGQVVSSRVITGLCAIGVVVLLIGLANLSGLVLTNSISRAGELAMQSLLGASRGRLISQFISDGLVVSLTGGLLGVGIARLLTQVFLATVPDQFGTWRAVSVSLAVPVDFTVWLFALVLCVVIGLTVGLAPYGRLRALSFASLLAAGHVVSTSHSYARLKNLVVIPQIAIAFALALVASSMVTAITDTEAAPLGFRTLGLRILDVDLPRPDTSQMAGAKRDRQIFNERLKAGLLSAREVRAVSLTDALPFRPLSTWIVSKAGFEKKEYKWIRRADVSATYFGELGIDIVAGRGFDAAEPRTGRAVALVSRDLAEVLFPGRSVLGEQIALHWPNSGMAPTWLEIIGVTSEVRHPLVGVSAPFVYVPIQEVVATFVIDTITDEIDIAPRIREIVQRIDSRAIVARNRSMVSEVAELRYPARVAAGLLVAGACVSLFLAGVGIHSTISFSVAQRRHEFGVRRAIGASRLQVLRPIGTEVMRMLGFGLAIGGVIAIAGGRIVNANIIEVPRVDLSGTVVLTILFVLLTLIASYAPARRALGVEPAEILRST